MKEPSRWVRIIDNDIEPGEDREPQVMKGMFGVLIPIMKALKYKEEEGKREGVISHRRGVARSGEQKVEEMDESGQK